MLFSNVCLHQKVSLTWKRSYICFNHLLRNYKSYRNDSCWNKVVNLTLSHIQQICSRQLWKHTRKKLETPCNSKYNNWSELKTCWQKEKLLDLSNFFFFRHVFKKLSAAEASESIYMRERVKIYVKLDLLIK